MVSGGIPLFRNESGKEYEVYAKIGYGPSYIASAFREETDLRSDDPVRRERIALGDGSILNQWDHGMHGSFGLAYKYGGNRLFIEADYYRGLKDAERFNSSRNRSVNLSAGFLVGL